VEVSREKLANIASSAASILGDARGANGKRIRNHARYIEDTVNRWLSSSTDTSTTPEK
jgi:hypothetical protein